MIFRSRSASYTRCNCPLTRYRTPPCTSLVARLEVACAKSPDSTSAVRNPRVAASTASPRPVAPPPTIKTSRLSFFVSSSRANFSARVLMQLSAISSPQKPRKPPVNSADSCRILRRPSELCRSSSEATCFVGERQVPGNRPQLAIPVELRDAHHNHGLATYFLSITPIPCSRETSHYN